MRQWYVQLDGLRFLAVSMVLIEHFAYIIGKHIHAGYFGVDLFFVLSGFLISEGLIVDKKSDKTRGEVIKNFYIKRALRIFPIYYLVVILGVVFFDQFKPLTIYALTYTVNYYGVINEVPNISAFSHLWSLSFEEQFYLFWPFVILFIRNKKVLLISMTVIMMASVTYFLYIENYQILPARMFALCFGAIMAFLKNYHNLQYKAKISKKALLLFITAILVYIFIHQAVGISLFSTMLVYLGTNNSFKGIFRKAFENNRITYIGKISYGIYLYHKPLAFVLTAYVFDPIWSQIDFSFLPQLQYNSWIIKLPLFYLVAVGVSHISFQYIERPILKYKNRLTAK